MAIQSAGRAGLDLGSHPTDPSPAPLSIKVQTSQLLHSTFSCAGKLQTLHGGAIHTAVGLKF